VLTASLGVYGLLVRPRLVRWGATDHEVERPFPGADLIPSGQRSSSTMAVTVDAPPRDVWPWLLQMGYGRGGWYSWDHLDNWGHASSEALHPEWQHVAVGDHLPALADGSQWWEVAALEPDHFLGLRMSLDLKGHPFDPTGPRPRFYTDSLWGFLLEETPERQTRLIVSGYWVLEPRWLQPFVTATVFEPSHWIMQRRQFQNLKRRVEPHSQLSSDLVWRTLARTSFAIVSHVTPAGVPRSSGVIFTTIGQRLYVAVAPDSWKARDITSGSQVAVTIPVRRGGILSLFLPIPPATISFHATALAHPPGAAARPVVAQARKALGSALPPERRESCTILELIPQDRFLTYGVGVPLLEMRTPERARARVAV
jgi:proline iminopeptidase